MIIHDDTFESTSEPLGWVSLRPFRSAMDRYDPNRMRFSMVGRHDYHLLSTLFHCVLGHYE